MVKFGRLRAIVTLLPDLADLTQVDRIDLHATEAIIADPQQVADDAAWCRTDWHEIQARKDGITMVQSGQSGFVRTVLKTVPVITALNDAGWLACTRDSQCPTASTRGPR